MLFIQPQLPPYIYSKGLYRHSHCYRSVIVAFLKSSWAYISTTVSVHQYHYPFICNYLTSRYNWALFHDFVLKYSPPRIMYLFFIESFILVDVAILCHCFNVWSHFGFLLNIPSTKRNVAIAFKSWCGSKYLLLLWHTPFKIL